MANLVCYFIFSLFHRWFLEKKLCDSDSCLEYHFKCSYKRNFNCKWEY